MSLLPGQEAFRAGLLGMSIVVAALAALATTLAAERSAPHATRRWQAQAWGAAALMLALMAREGFLELQPASVAAHLALAVLLTLTAAAGLEGGRLRGRAVRLVLDAAVVSAILALVAGLLAPGTRGGAVLAGSALGAFGAAGYAVLVMTNRVARAALTGADALLLWGTGLVVLYVGGLVSLQLRLPVVGLLSTPGIALLAALCFLRSAHLGATRRGQPAPYEALDDSRLRILPAAFAGAVIALLTVMELTGNGSQVGFLGIVGLFAMIVGRLVFTLLENRELLRSVERSGVFEEKLRDLGAALLAALDRKEALELVCRTAQVAFRSEWVLLWMLDRGTSELEAVEVLGPKRSGLLHRRFALDDPTSLAVRVAQTGESEIVSHVPASGLGNPFLNVLLGAHSLLAVPVTHDQVVQGVLVCVDTATPTAFGAHELAKAELLASQVAVALDNAYQHDLQRRRLEEVTALYQFAQSAHTAVSPPEIARQILPILKERLRYTYAAVWVRDTGSGTLRLAAGDSPGGVPQAGGRPSELAMRACNTGEPVRAGLGWAEKGDFNPPRSGIKSQLCVPLVLKHRLVGVVDLESRQQDAYSLNDERLLVSVANHAALAIDNLHLADETRKVVALKELDRMKSELLSTVSHELRTPLGSIKGYATTLLTHDHKLRREERREFLEIIDSEADRLRELIENLLDLSRIEAGVLRIDRCPVRLGAVAQDVVRKAELASPEHTLVLDWPADPPVSADARRVYQVIQNLVSNAVKYSPGGGRITVSADATPRELLVSISDEGLGMPQRELDRIFDRFHRVPGEVSRNIGGTGLGLAISKAFVEAHNGRIWAESGGDGQGSTFRFTLPTILTEGSPMSSTPTSLLKGAS